jgi:hypothetical protein
MHAHTSMRTCMHTYIHAHTHTHTNTCTGAKAGIHAENSHEGKMAAIMELDYVDSEGKEREKWYACYALCVCVCVCVYVVLCIYIYIYIYIYICIIQHTYIHINMYVCMYVWYILYDVKKTGKRKHLKCAYVPNRLNTCLYVCVYKYIYMCT